jgi:hypothetical protein
LYTDRHSIFEPQDKGHALPDAVTQLGRALQELDIELICAHSPQAKGRIERSFGKAQDRWVKELRLGGSVRHPTQVSAQTIGQCHSEAAFMSIVEFAVAFGHRREDRTRPGVLTPVSRAFAA